jgi:hypothetical protein
MLGFITVILDLIKTLDLDIQPLANDLTVVLQKY